MEVLTSDFVHESSYLRPPKIPVVTFQLFFKNREVHQHQCTGKFMKLTTDIIDAGVNNYGGDVFPNIYIDRGNTGSKFATGVNNAGGKLPPASTTPAVNCHQYQQRRR
jgi:hypothetical protein